MNDWFMMHFTTSYFVAGIILFFLGLLVLIKNPRHTLNQIFSLYSFAIAWWAIWSIPMINVDTDSLAIWLDRICLIGTIFIPTLFLHFNFIILKLGNKWNRLLPYGYALSWFFFVSDFTPLFVRGAGMQGPAKHFTEPGIFYHLFVVYFITNTIIGISLFVKKLFVVPKNTYYKRQLWYLLWGTIIGYTGGGLNFQIIYHVGFPWLAPLGNYGITVYGMLVAYAIVRYKLLDIRIVINRAVVFVLVYIPILLIPIGFTYWNYQLLNNLFGQYFWLVPTVIEGICGMVGLFLYQKVKVKTEQRILQEEYQNALEIKEVAQGLLCIGDLQSLAKSVMERCKGILKVEGAFFYAKDTCKNEYVFIFPPETDKGHNLYPVLAEGHALIDLLKNKHTLITKEEIDVYHPASDFLNEMKVYLAVPCFLKDELSAILLLGEKSRSRVYAPMELDALQSLTDKIAQAIAHVEAVSQARVVQEKIDTEERLQSEKDLREQHETYQKKLVDASRKLLTMKTLKDLAPYTMEMIHEHIDPVYAGIYIYDWDKGEYVRMAFLGNPLEENPRPIKKEEVLIKYLFDRKDPVLYEDIRRWAEESASSELSMVEEEMRQLNAHLIIPMVTDSFVGFLVLGKRRSQAVYTASDGNTFILVANNTAMAIHSIHMFKDSITDSMTSLWNRKQYADLLEKMVDQAVRLGNPLCLLMFDIDLFKLYNDTYGHEAGDLILGSVGEYLRTVNRSSDMLFRWGGEEFAIIAINTDRESAMRLAERIREGMRHEPILSAITFSIGISCVQPDPAADPKCAYDIHKTTELLQKQADNALYEAKHTGRDRVCADKAFRPVLKETDKTKRPLHVLVVEDEETFCKKVSQHLRLKKFFVRTAATCKEAETLFREEIPDVVLLDLRLPDGDGSDLYKKVFARHPEVIVGAMSGFGDRKAGVLALGMKMFWLKPLDFPELTEWLQKVERERF